MIFGNAMMYGLFVVIPGLLLIIPISFTWFNRSARYLVQTASKGGRPWTLSRWLTHLYLPLVPRMYVAFTVIAIAFRAMHDEVEDPPLGPFSATLVSVLIWSLSMALLYALSHFIEDWRVSRKSLLADPTPEL